MAKFPEMIPVPCPLCGEAVPLAVSRTQFLGHRALLLVDFDAGALHAHVAREHADENLCNEPWADH